MDDEPDWLTGGDDEPEPEPTPALGKKDAGKKDAAAAEAPEDEKAADEEAPAAEEAAEEAADEYLDPDKLILFKHWKRPKFLGYKYLTDYRQNYYDDVIDYLDKRNKGITRDIPVAQTWAERVIRKYSKNSNRADIFRIKIQDKKLVDETRFSGKFQLHHGKNYMNTKFYTQLF